MLFVVFFFGISNYLNEKNISWTQARTHRIFFDFQKYIIAMEPGGEVRAANGQK